MIDWERMRELREEIGEEDYSIVMDLFFEEVDEAINRLSRPADMVAREADLHFLKGSSLNIGFTRLGDLCEEGELRAAEGSLDDAEVETVIATYRATRQQFLATRTDA